MARHPWSIGRVVVIGPRTDPYMIRRTIFSCPLFALYLHEFRRSDADHEFHDHPYGFVSFILRGGYWEETPRTAKPLTARETDWRTAYYAGDVEVREQRWFGRFRFLRRPATWKHRILLDPAMAAVTSTWTLVLAGTHTREWGFWCPSGWVKWTDYLRREESHRC